MKHKYLILLFTLLLASYLGMANNGETFDLNSENSSAALMVADQDSLYYLCDGGDRLYRMDKVTEGITYIGSTAGGTTIEAIAYNGFDDELYGINSGTFMKINKTDGSLTTIADIDGGTALDGSDGAIWASDVDALAFDTWTGNYWAAARRSGTFDILFKIDASTGEAIRDAFGTGIDYLLIDGTGVNKDIDDIAIDPTSGQLYAVTTVTGSSKLIEVNRFTGSVVSSVVMDQPDAEGLDFTSDGVLYATLGLTEEIWITELDGTMTDVVDLGDGGSCWDVEAVTGTTAPADTIGGKVWDDADYDMTIGAEPGIPGVTVELIYDTNNNGIYDSGDVLLQTTTTDASGDYGFEFATDANLLVQIDPSTLPVSYALTTDNVETASFTVIANTEQDYNNDFGAATGADCDGDGIPDFVEGSDDTDDDGVNNDCDLDSDNDGILDAVEGMVDTDDDGIVDALDKDSDNDGIPDAIEANNGVAPAGYDSSVGIIVGSDTDNDGLLNDVDDLPGTAYGASASILPNLDNDNDGYNDNIDLDADNDGILDVVEAGGTDVNGDGIVDGFDDSGVVDGYDDDLTTTPLPVDNFDGTGHPDYIDIDADDDGIVDNIEGQTTDDYSTPGVVLDVDEDGIIDYWDTSFGGTPINPTNTDGQGNPDYIDIDADDDGIVDNTEGQTTDGYVAPSGTDTDGDGLDDAYDPDCTPCGPVTGVAMIPENNDNADETDFRDLDADNDGIADTIEGHDSDGDGVADSGSPANTGFSGGVTDADNDGLLDGYDNNTASVDPTNTNLEGEAHPDEKNGTLEQDWRETPDVDGDGIVDALDLDDDNDGIPDAVECAPYSNGQSGAITAANLSSSISGTPSDQMIAHNLNSITVYGDTYSDFIVPNSYSTTLSQPGSTGIIYVMENGSVPFDYATSGSAWSTDAAPAYQSRNLNYFIGIDGNQNDSSYNEIHYTNPVLVTAGFYAVFMERNQNNAVNIQAFDAAGNALGARQFYNPSDYVGTGVNVATPGGAGQEVGLIVVPLEDFASIGDQISSFRFYTAHSSTSDEADGKLFILGNLNTICTDTDKDGIADYLDIDADNDGIPDVIEAGGTDTDGDGHVDYPTPGDPSSMVDIDGDGLADTYDDEDTAGSTPGWTDGTPIANEDSDDDGIVDALDLDADNDGIPDIIEAGGTDTDGDGLVDNITDTDNDGLVDTYDPNNEITSGTNEGTEHFVTGPDSGDGTPTIPCPDCDSDGDGNPDHLDLDADNDGIPDIVEAGGVDTDGDGQVDNPTDSDEDGYADVADPSNEDNPGTNEGTEYFVTGPDSGDGTPTEMCADCDKDEDGNPDHLDLDADNDGIPDVVEAGGIDTDGDGQVDSFTDVDGDGLADVYDTDDNTVVGTDDGGTALVETDGSGNMIDGATGDSVDTDGDGNPDHLDIDADNDGITDIVEVGGDDPDGDGMVDTGLAPWDTDGDGLADVYDTDDNTTAGTGDGATDALVVTSADANSDGHLDGTEIMEAGGAGSLPNVNEDSADEVGGIPSLPNQLDIDADNDGIVDNSEAQPTDDYTAPTGYDDDNDGLDNAYDPDCVGGCTNSDGVTMDVTGDPMVLENTDMTDTPDWIDSDSDNDGVSDIDEAGAGVDPNATPEDLDGDGLIWDDMTAGAGAGNDPTNTNDTPSTFDDNDDPGVDQDWRQGDCPLCKMEYGIQDGSGSQTTNYNYNPATNLLETTTDTYGVIRTNKYCEIGGWRYYYNPASPTEALFAMRGTAADLDKLDYIEITVEQIPADREAGTVADSYSRIMYRDWYVELTSPQDDPIDVRFYYPGDDFGTNGFQAADTEADNYSLTDTPDITWFNVPDWDTFDPTTIDADATNLTGMTDFEELTPVTAANTSTGISDTDGDATTVGNGKNYVQFDDIAKIGGGTAGYGVGASALPVELNHFTANTNGCSVDLNWNVEGEVNFSHYELEWSGDGRNFQTIKTVQGSGSTEIRNYVVEDNQAEDDNYYRLKMIDLDGTFDYSRVIYAATDCAVEGKLSLYPNPIMQEDGMLNVKFIAAREGSELIVVDMLGRQVKRISFTLESREWNTNQIDVSDLPVGTYNVRVVGQRASKMFMIIE